MPRAPIDSYGVGTSLVTSADYPYLDMVYKLQEYAGRPRRKRSAGKATWPGRKQVYRYYHANGTFAREAAREHASRQLQRLPAWLRSLKAASVPYPVEIAPALKALAEDVDRAT